jgi:excisionase family DNA binding protein
VYIIVNMSQCLNAPQSKFLPLDLVNIFKAPATAAPQPAPSITFPMPSVSLPNPAMLQKLKHGWLKRLTSHDLLNVSGEVLIEALCEKGAVLTTEEMARLGKCDKETIRRLFKAGHLKKIDGIRHIRISAEKFFDWLLGRSE